MRFVEKLSRFLTLDFVIERFTGGKDYLSLLSRWFIIVVFMKSSNARHGKEKIRFYTLFFVSCSFLPAAKWFLVSGVPKKSRIFPVTMFA